MTIRETNWSIEAVKVLDGYCDDYLQDILRLERECFPADWQYPEAEAYYSAMLKDSQNINVFLLECGVTIGYLLAKPLNVAAVELCADDPDIRPDEAKVYIENIQIHPSYQGWGYARLLLTVVCDEALKQGITKFAIHARTNNSFNAKVKKVFEKSIYLMRDIEKWRWANGEPCQYIEWEYMPVNGMNKT